MLKYDNYYYNQYSNTIEIKRVWLTVPFSEVVTRENETGVPSVVRSTEVVPLSEAANTLVLWYFQSVLYAVSVSRRQSASRRVR